MKNKWHYNTTRKKSRQFKAPSLENPIIVECENSKGKYQAIMSKKIKLWLKWDKNWAALDEYWHFMGRRQVIVTANYGYARYLDGEETNKRFVPVKKHEYLKNGHFKVVAWRYL